MGLEKMNILFVTYTAGMYGANICLLHMMKDLRTRYGVTPYVLMIEEGDLSAKCRDEGIHVIIENYHNWRTRKTDLFSMMKGYGKVRLNWLLGYRIAHKIRKLKINCVHSNSTLFDMGYIVSKYLRVPHIWHLREYGLEDYNLHYLYPNSKISSEFLHSKYCIAISKDIYAHYTQRLRLSDPKRTVVIYDGVDIPEEYEKTYLQDGRIHFCVCGLLSPGKNQINVIEACEMLTDCRNKFRVHFLGDSANGYDAELRRMVVSKGLEDVIIFHGYVNNPHEILRTMDVGIMPSKREAFGRVTVEYMLNYMPVIGAATGGTKELIDEKSSGKLYELDDIRQLAQSMRYCIQHPEWVQTCGQSARNYAAEKFSLDRNTDRVFSLYEQILGKEH